MTKISKNIRKFRTQKNLTQEDIAKSLFVTRQTVSSWESGRTQPDIETLVKISELFEVSTEELIYGRIKTDSENKNASRLRLIIIFSVIGSVFTAVGLTLIFVNYWDKFPMGLKSVFAFIPMLAGQGAAVYTFLKKRESVPWCEGASVLWCSGVTATIALMDSIHLFMTDFSDCLFIDILLTLPVIFILDAVTPLLFIHFGINYLFFDNIFRTQSMLITNAVILTLFAAALSYVYINRAKKDDPKHIFSQWISLISFSIIIITDIICCEAEEPGLWIMITTYFAALYFLFYEKPFRLPYTPIGLIGTVGMSVAGVFLYHPDMMGAPYFGYDMLEKIKLIICAALCILLMAATGIIKRKVLFKNKISIALFAFTSLLILSEALCCIFNPENNRMIFYFVTLISAYAISFTITADGVMSNNFLFVNIGLIATAVNLVFMLYNIIELNILAAGFMLLLFGIALFVVNFLLAKKIKKSKEENSDA